MRDARKVAQIFKALSSETRVHILQLLKQRPLCVGALASRLDFSSAAVSQHLRILRDADLVTARKRGYYVHYQVNQKTLSQWRKMTNQLLGADAE